MKLKICIVAVAIIGFLAGFYITPKVSEPIQLDPQVQRLQDDSKQLREQMDQLRQEMADVKNVQGYITWERDWRNQVGKP